MGERHRLSGRQITIMFVAACVAVVMAPVGVMATSHTVVTLRDGKHPSQLAHIASDGSQLVNVTGSTTVAGTVTAVPGKPGKPYSVSGSTQSGAAKIAIPTGSHFVVETVSVEIIIADAVTVAGADITYVENGRSFDLGAPVARVLPQDPPGPAVFMATFAASIYPDPGSTVTVQPFVDSTTPASTVVTLSGYRD
jgi:hypothetical protein